jgi:predicted PurR-regulated permease PerM
MTSSIVVSAAPEVCSSPGLAAANFGETFGLSLASMVGLGGIFGDLGAETPLDKLKAQVRSITSQVQEFNNKATQQFAKTQSEFDDQIMNSIDSMQKNNQTLLNYNNEILQDEISSNSTYVASVFVLTLIVLFYILTLSVK